MTQLAPNLDDLRFQKDLVDEARRRIIRYCPEWTDYNLSDPGITLIELFAYMTEMLIYRLNRVPEKNYLKFLEMLGMNPQSASSARVELTFYLSVPFPITQGEDIRTTIPQGLEVSTRPSDEEEEIVFTVDDRLVLAPPRLVQLRREAEFNKNYLPRLGIEPFYAFNNAKPQQGDTFYIGFDETQDIKGYIMRLSFGCEETQAVGVRRDDPPLVWECSLGENRWQEMPMSNRKGEKDTTGGLNNAHGSLVLHLPLAMKPDVVQGKSAFWLRCRLDTRREEQGMYAVSPRISGIEAQVMGGKARATHATIVLDEALGTSNGEPGQIFHLRHAPVLALREEEEVQVEELREGAVGYIPWAQVEDFSRSNRFDRCFTLDVVSGDIKFGPAVRQTDGAICQYGRIPEAGRRVRITQYRYGGGVTGNVPAEKIQLMHTAVAYIDRVMNFTRAEGGRDQENIDELKMRAQRELRTQQRAVIAEDFENLGKMVSREVARVKCRGAGPGGKGQVPGVIELLVVPAAFDSIRAGDLTKLVLEPALQSEIRTHLDKYRLLATVLNIREPCYIGVKVHAEIAITTFSRPEAVKAKVIERLNEFLSPLSLIKDDQPSDLFGSQWEGWPFGRDMYISELFALIQQVPGVKHVLDVRASYRTIQLGKAVQNQKEASGSVVDQTTLAPVTQRVLHIQEDTLLCSLNHEVEVVEL